MTTIKTEIASLEEQMEEISLWALSKNVKKVENRGKVWKV